MSLIEKLYKAGFTHRDIKPDNIAVTMVNGRFELRLIDFGLAASLNQHLNKHAGTLHYMAPEVYTASRDPVNAVMSDIFSLAATILALVTGRLPLSYPHERFVRLSEIFNARVHLTGDNDKYSNSMETDPPSIGSSTLQNCVLPLPQPTGLLWKRS